MLNFLFSFFFLGFNAHGYLNQQFEKQALKVYSFKVPQKDLPEKCYLLLRFPGLENKVSKDEDALCAMNLYSSASDHPKAQTFYSCPKVKSTSVAVEFYSAPNGVSETKFQKEICPLTHTQKKNIKARLGYPDKEAKYKFSSPGVSVGSILAYSRLAQLFKAVDVPAVVLRTVDLDTILNHALTGRYLAEQMGNKYLLAHWSAQIGHLVKAKHGDIRKLPDAYTQPPFGLGIVPSEFYTDSHRQLSSVSSNYWGPRLLTEDKKQVFGALAENPGKEALYKEAFGTKIHKTRIDQFRNSSVFWPLLKDTRPLTEILGSRDLSKVGQKLLGMQETSSMLVMDFLLSQADRIGNIHYKKRQFFINGQGHLDDISEKKYRNLLEKARESLTPEEVEILNAIRHTGVSLKVMLLKDNDGGFDTNTAKKYHLLANVNASSSDYNSWKDNTELFLNATMVVRHFSPQVYKGVIQLYKQVFGEPESQKAMQAYFLESLRFTATEYKIFKNNLLSLYYALYNNCKTGALYLDLDMKDYFSATPDPVLTTTPGVCEGQF